MTRLGSRFPKGIVGLFLLIGAVLGLLWGAVGSGITTGTNRPLAAATGVQATISCLVERVVDGDTIVCTDAGRVRLLLIDTPELDQGPFGEVAKTALEGLLPVGVRVELVTDVTTRDQYDRLLAYLYLPDGRMANEVLLEIGMAVVSVYPPNVRHVDRFRSIVAEAREAKRGLWATAAFECLPSDHRAGRC